MKMLTNTVEREAFLAKEVGADFSEYNNTYYEIIHELFVLKFGSDLTQIINFYAYEMINPEGTRNTLKDEQGKTVKLDNAEDLWDLIQKVTMAIKNNKEEEK